MLYISYSHSLSTLHSFRMSSIVILNIGLILFIFSAIRSSFQHEQEMDHVLQVPLSSTPVPPVNTENCYTFEVYLNDSTISSLNVEDFPLVRNKAIIRPRGACRQVLKTNPKTTFCAETNITFQPKVMCNANYRTSIIVCRKWWGEKHQELMGNNTDDQNTNPPPSKHIELLCFIFPRRPWCRPRIKLLSSPESVELESSNDWFIAGILRDYNYNLLKDKYCNSTLTPQKDEQFVTTTKDLFQKFTTTQNF